MGKCYAIAGIKLGQFPRFAGLAVLLQETCGFIGLRFCSSHDIEIGYATKVSASQL
jgi:hypothetical protein